jgi:hypothetical protein
MIRSFTGDFPFDYEPLFEQLSLFPDEESDDSSTQGITLMPNLSKLVIYQWPLIRKQFNVAVLTDMIGARWYPHPSITASADDLGPPLGRRLTTVILHTKERGSLKTQIGTALRPFSKQGLIVGVDIEPKGYQVDLKVDW